MAITLIDQLGARRAAFHFVERFDASLQTLGPRELIAKIARWLPQGSWDAPLPDVRPFWQGSYLPFDEAARRFGVPEVWTVVVGCRDTAERRGLVKHIRSSPPLGMFKLEAAVNWPPEQASLPLHGFVVPNAAIEFASRRHVDRATGLDIIGIDEEESAMLDGLAGWGDVDGDDPLGRQLLKTLAKRIGRSIPSASATDEFSELVDQSFDLYGLGAVSLAGAVAGVAFETLMRAALDPAGQAWAANKEAQGGHVQLNDVIAKAVSAGHWDGARLQSYRVLRNDFAHRLGDDDAHQRDADELRAELGRFLRWLDRQSIDDHGQAALTDVPPEPTLDDQQIYDLAVAAGKDAADRTKPSLIRIENEEFEPFGSSWVIVDDRRLPFSRWLIDHGHASPDDHGVRLHAPYAGLERGLAWAQACAAELRKYEIVAYDGGVPD